MRFLSSAVKRGLKESSIEFKESMCVILRSAATKNLARSFASLRMTQHVYFFFCAAGWGFEATAGTGIERRLQSTSRAEATNTVE